MRQLLPVTLRSYRHAVAALGTRLPPGDLAITATALASCQLTHEIPLMRAPPCKAAVPMPPVPTTTTVSPSRTLARWTADPYLVGMAQASSAALNRPRCSVFMQYSGAGSHQPSGVSLLGPAFRGPLAFRGFRRAGGESARGG